MPKILENNGTEEIGLLTPTPSVQYRAAIFTEYYPRIEDWIYLTKSSR